MTMETEDHELARHLDIDTLDSLISVPVAISSVESAIRELHADRLEQPPRTVVGDGQLLVMSALHRETRDAVVKTLTIYDIDGTRRIEGTVLWYDGVTGLPSFSVDAHRLTALRTGAVSGVATKLLAPASVRKLSILGAGAQAETQLDSCCAVREFEEISVYNRTAETAHRFVAAAKLRHPGMHISVAASAHESVADADVVCSATGATSPLFDLAVLKADVHVNAVGAFRPSMAELPVGLIENSTITVLDDIAGCLEGSGEVRSAVERGFLVGGFRSLGSVLDSGFDRQGRTVFKSVGCAALDWGVGKAIADRLDGRGRP
ncbi:ornithine cyclodeaminase [Rhodococcus sp. 27YEA15]|uniref:ornithine cyclodeaminase family protein n=1 Tax=Rhodococcus sp. 27YEA15 TaxID=3156259 RepID=UPI003C79BC74